MKRNVFLFIGLSILALSAIGCRAGGQGYAQSPLGGQYQQPVLGGYQQPALPNMQQTQQGLGQIGRNLGSRFSNGIINRGVNYAINSAISAF